MRGGVTLFVAVLVHTIAAQDPPPPRPPPAPPMPPLTPSSQVYVNDAAGLRSAVAGEYDDGAAACFDGGTLNTVRRPCATTVILASGEYALSSTLYIRRSLSIVAAEPGTVIITVDNQYTGTAEPAGRVLSIGELGCDLVDFSYSAACCDVGTGACDPAPSADGLKVLLSGLVITGGHVEGSQSGGNKLPHTYGNGGGVRIGRKAVVEIIGCNITNNVARSCTCGACNPSSRCAAGVRYSLEAWSVHADCLLLLCTVDAIIGGAGGGIFVANGANVTIIDRSAKT